VRLKNWLQESALFSPMRSSASQKPLAEESFQNPVINTGLDIIPVINAKYVIDVLRMRDQVQRNIQEAETDQIAIPRETIDEIFSERSPKKLTFAIGDQIARRARRLTRACW
jgi:hypothetical protein